MLVPTHESDQNLTILNNLFMREEQANKTPIIHESEFAYYRYDKESKLLFHIFKKNATSRMKKEDYKKESKIELKLCLQNQVSALVLDTSNFDFPISPDLQKWTNETIFSKQNSIQKCAIISSQDLIGRLSLNQVFDKREATFISFQTSFFDSLQEATSWARDTVYS